MFSAWRVPYLRSAALVVVLVLLMGAVAQNPGTTVDLTTSAATGYPMDVFVTLGDHYFAPDDFTIKVGQTVRFRVTTMGRSFHHDFLIMEDDANVIVAGHPAVIPFDTNATVEWTPTAPGTYRIACAVCPWMTGVIHVVA